MSQTWRNYTPWANEQDEKFQKIFEFKPEQIVVFDLETTGLNRAVDEIIQVSFINGAGEILLNSYIKPKKKKTWPEAQAINGITPAMVAGAPGIDELKETIQKILDNAKLVVGYNSVGFDMEFLSVAGIDTKTSVKHFDVMLEASPTTKSWSSKYSHWKWETLERAADRFGYDGYEAHDAGRDTQATLFVFEQILNDETRGSWRDYHNFINWLRANGKAASSDNIKFGWLAWTDYHDQYVAGTIRSVNPYNGAVYLPDGSIAGESYKEDDKVKSSASQTSPIKRGRRATWKIVVAALLLLSAFTSLGMISDGIDYLFFALVLFVAAFWLGCNGFGYRVLELVRYMFKW